MQHLEGSGTPVLYIGRTVLKGLSIKKNPNDTIGNRTRDLPACSAVPQPNASPRAPPPYNTDQTIIQPTKMYFLLRRQNLLLHFATYFKLRS